MEMISNGIIKLQTPLDSELRLNEETGGYYLVHHHTTQYEFTIAEVENMQRGVLCQRSLRCD